jgi:glutathione S-transferase
MKLFWCPQTRAARVLWMLEELGIEYELVNTDIRAEEDTHRAELLTASPMGKVPAIIDGDVRMAESAAICLYLADKYASGRLAPNLDAPERGSFLYWMMYVPGVIEPAMMEKFRGGEANKFASGWGDFPTMIKTLEDALDGNDWLVGNTFSAADVMVGSSCYFVKKFGILPEGSQLDAYVKRCVARPAYKTALELDDAG